MEPNSLDNMMKYLTEPYYPQKLSINDFQVLFDVVNESISKEKKRLITQQTNGFVNRFTSPNKLKSTNKSKSLTKFQTQNTSHNESNQPKESLNKSNFILTQNNNQIFIKRIQGKKVIEPTVTERKKEILQQILTERSAKITNGPSEYTLRPKYIPKKFSYVPISSAINRYQYQYPS